MNEVDELIAQWKELASEDSDHFNDDGVICDKAWNQSKKKVLFILKETNDYKGSISKLIYDAVTVRPKSKLWARPTFHNIGRWAYGLLNYSDCKVSYKKANDERKKALLSCAFINIKKTTGGRTATKAVEKSAIKHSSLLKKQIDLLQPDIIVFGGTYKIIKDHVLPELTKVAYRVHKYNNVVCINANHPACTKKRKEIYDQVIDNYINYIAET